MPKLIINGAVAEDRWPVDHIQTLERWQELAGKASTAVCLEPDQAPTALLEHLSDIKLVVINFTSFMDGRGFSYARELRDQGYTGELRASGNFMVDQLHYLQRCGFDSFEVADDVNMDNALAQLDLFDQHYQASADTPLPLSRRRA
jgi:uncharacterized protein (DUF934 family)